MSVEEGKAAATFTSFINKNTTGKKFAPKAARRRPNAAPTTPAPPSSGPEAHTKAVPTEASVASRSTTLQLLTPAATQEPANDVLAQIVQVPGTATATALSEPALTNESLASQHALDVDRPNKRRRIEPPAQQNAISISASDPDTGNNRVDHPPARQDGAATQDDIQIQLPPPVETTELLQASAQTSEADRNCTAAVDSSESQPRRRKKLPWVAVNHPEQDGGEAEADPAAVQSSTRARGKQKTTAEMGLPITTEHNAHPGDPTSTRERPSATARGKAKAGGAAEAGTDVQIPKTRTRASRKAKKTANTTTEDVEEAGAETAQEVEGSVQTSVLRKPRALRKKKRTTTACEGGDGESATATKAKGRPPRSATPSDAEDQTIDPDITFMDSLATRNIRVGKLSAREKEMRKINWAEVREKRREEDSRPIQSKQEQEAADRLLAEAGAAIDQQPEARVRTALVDGVIQIVHESGIVDREAQADREIAEYEIIETQDLTTRITSRSFMKNNKRFPNEFVLPGQGKRWNPDSTDLFYQGLKSFGTDFQMISHMFPGSTRRSMKTKFTREEREDPDRVRAALQGRSEMASHWDVFLEASQMKEESFKDADAIKKELAEKHDRMQEQIEAAKEEAAERRRQKEIAGLLDDENEGDDATNKENGKGKKKRKEKGKKVAFQEEAGVEILEENIGMDDSWFQQQQ